MGRIRLTPEQREANRKARSKATWAKLNSGEAYKKYDPLTEGYGTPESWIHGFEEMMGAIPAVQDSMLAALKVLGLSSPASSAQVLSAFRIKIKEFHPTYYSGPDAHERTIEIISAYKYLKDRMA